MLSENEKIRRVPKIKNINPFWHDVQFLKGNRNGILG